MSVLISEMSEAEFLIFVKKIYNDEYETEEGHIDAILKFERLVEHPSGSDLLFYPEPGKSGPEAVVKEVKEWRAANGKVGFKI
ncbi:MAG: bacteriocin immunity protein [Janthinobacterium lividum]